MKKLDVTMAYNYHLWLVHYFMHLDTIETLSNIGDPTMLSMMEMTEMMPSVNLYSAATQEIGDLSP